jgi:predicted dehydrogenase
MPYRRNIKLGYIGSGPISNFHIPAIKQLGFKIELFYSRNFDKAYKFSKDHKIIIPVKTFEDFIDKSKNLDGIVLSIKTDATFGYLKKLCKLGKPIFVEKPGALKSIDLKKIKKITNSKIYFLYNRRFYSSIKQGKNFVNSSKQCFTSVKIPDSIKTIHQFIINGCHVIDILLFYFGDLSVLKSYKLKKNIGYYFLLKSKKQHLVSCLLNWGSPQNFEINIFNEKNERLELRPLETSFFYNKMKQINPTKENPIRSYVPKLIKKKTTIFSGMKFKPGFIEQYSEVIDIIKKKKKNYTLCNLDSAIKVLSLIEMIITKTKSK